MPPSGVDTVAHHGVHTHLSLRVCRGYSPLLHRIYHSKTYHMPGHIDYTLSPSGPHPALRQKTVTVSIF